VKLDGLRADQRKTVIRQRLCTASQYADIWRIAIQPSQSRRHGTFGQFKLAVHMRTPMLQGLERPQFHIELLTLTEIRYRAL
jgi:hypothetical protein